MKSKGTVYLVGAGPGDAGLLTLRGAELLRRADVVIYDALANPELLRLAPTTAEFISRGKNMAMPQAEITALIIARANAGKTVVRLKGGDPYVFGRGAEEVEALAAAKIPFEIVPGVSSITAVPNYAGIPLTHREHCSSFTVFTGHSDSADAATALRYDQIAKIPGTKVVLMGTEQLGDWTKSLVANGMSPQTPIAIIHRGTTGRQKTIAGTLATIAALAAKGKIVPPALTIIGDVVKLRGKLNWFENRPLFGQRVVVTRRSEQAGIFAQRLTELGADVLEVPTIKITMPTEKDAIVDCLLELNSYEWLVFTSANGVTAFFDIFFRRFHDLRDLGGARIAAVGPATTAKLRELHLQVDLMPEEYTGKKIAAAFKKYQHIDNVKMCLLRAEVANSDLPDALHELGAIVDDIAIYKTVPETEDPTGAATRLPAEGADWVTFTSSSTVEHFHARFDLPKLLKKFPKLKLASIGPETSKAISVLGLKPTLEAKEHTTDGLIAALLKATKA
ncbi:MAG TPA: uroporphyrinogen-III C-methyltransferase [Candidatus Limnocylindrales bacterium]|nr:uroporphyrinogen-III C-methyltransferase [Candidatus Limnocylindrales bacterium]